MSRSKSGLSNEVKDVRRFVNELGQRPWVKAVYLIGSRSPNTEKQPRDESDWDIQVERCGDGFLPNPRNRGINACLSQYGPIRPEAVLVWPEDEHGLLDG